MVDRTITALSMEDHADLSMVDQTIPVLSLVDQTIAILSMADRTIIVLSIVY